MIANSVMSSAPLLPKVAITGLGLVTPLGVSKAAFFAGLRDGHSALARHPQLAGLLPGELCGQPIWAGRIQDFGAEAAIEASKRRRMPRLSQMAIVAAREAAGLGPAATAKDAAILSRYRADRVAVVLGTGLGCLDSTIDFTKSIVDGGMAAASPAVFPYTVMNASAGLLAIELGLLGPNVTINHRELSLPEAIATGAELLATGRADAVLCGGCDELSPWLVHGLWRLSALSPQIAVASEPPLHPYQLRSPGIVPGEGAVVVLLERAEATPTAPVLGYLSGWGRAGECRPRVGWSVPAADLTPPSPAPGAARAIQQSLAMTAISTDELSWIAGAGNGTDLDVLETRALRVALGDAAERVAISSIIGQCGEWQTSAGARLGASLWALSEQRLPGTTFCHQPDPLRSLPGLLRSTTTAQVNHVLMPTLSQGGGNISLLVSRA